jgi:peptidyl-prolyl cis-trans isomerase SurA
VRPLLITLEPGEVSEPLPIPNGIAIFLMRGLQETEGTRNQNVSIDYAQVFLPAGAAGAEEAARLRANSDGCDDLFGLMQDAPAERLVRQTQAAGEVPRDVALELAKLDDGETSTLMRGQNPVMLMLCSRTAAPVGEEEPPSRDQIRNQIINQRLAALAAGYLEELRAQAIIREP